MGHAAHGIETLPPPGGAKVPGAQHALAPGVPEDSIAAQASHRPSLSAPALSLNLPAGQGAGFAAATVQKKPTPHSVQPVERGEAKNPPLQHTAEPAIELSTPGEHGVLAVEKIGHLEPWGQVMQEAPSGLNAPTSQHTVEPALLHVLAGQGTGAAALAGQVVFWGQVVQLLATSLVGGGVVAPWRSVPAHRAAHSSACGAVQIGGARGALEYQARVRGRRRRVARNRAAAAARVSPFAALEAVAGLLDFRRA